MNQLIYYFKLFVIQKKYKYTTKFKNVEHFKCDIIIFFFLKQSMFGYTMLHKLIIYKYRFQKINIFIHKKDEEKIVSN